MTDISPNFVPNKTDRKIIRRLLPCEGTPQAIKVFANQCNHLSDYAYWFMLSTLWVSYTGWSDLALWRKLFSARRPDRATSLMKPSEIKVLSTLPENLTVYRAHREGEEDFLSFTLDAHAAAKFAMRRGVSKIHKYHLQKSAVLALFLRRGEAEVLTLHKELALPLGKIEVIVA